MDVSVPVNKSSGPTQNPQTPRKNTGMNSNKDWKNNKWLRYLNLALIGAILVVLIALLVGVSSVNNSQSKFLDKNNLQAVFLNTGQVYFGNVTALNKDYIVISNIFYLQTTSSGANNSDTSINLIKLGCEIHSPLDKMVINQNEVTFWENLAPSGQVAKAVKNYWSQNPSGQKCTDQKNAGTSGQAAPQGTTKQ